MEKILSAEKDLFAGRFAEALKGFDFALAANPGDARALFGRANVLKMMGRLDEARAG